MTSCAVSALRLTVQSLVSSASPEALRACETVLRQHSGITVGDPHVVTQAPQQPGSRRRGRRGHIAQGAHHPDPQEPAVGAEESVRDEDAGQAMRIVSYDTTFLRHVSHSTLIGDRYHREEVSGQSVVDGVHAEFRKYKEEVERLRAANRADEADELFKWGRRFRLPDQCIDALIGENVNPKIGVVRLYSAETGVYPAVNKTMRVHDESKVGLRPYVRLLHDTLSNPIPPMFRWGGTCFRWMELPEEMLAQYEVQTYELNNYISYGGFTSASRTGEAAWWNRVQFCKDSNVLIIFEQGTAGPTDISFLSQYPEEAEVLYSLGQTFRKDKKVTASFGEVCTIMGAPPVCEGWPIESFDFGPVNVIYLTAVDVFHELAEDLYRGGGTADEAMPLLQSRLQYEVSCGHDAKLGEAKALLTLGKAHTSAAKYDQAMEFVERSMKIRRSIRGEEHEDIAECLCVQAELCRNKADFTQAMDLAQRSLDIRRARLGELHGSTADSLVLIARVHREMDDFDRALEQLHIALPIYRAAVGERHPKVAECQMSIGGALLKKKGYAEALAAYSVALSIQRESLGAEHPDVASVLNNMAIVYNSQGDAASALQAYEQALAVYRKAYGERHPKIAKILYNMGNVHFKEGNHARALSSYEEALSIESEALGAQHPKVGGTLNNMGIAYKAAGQMQKAQESFLKAVAVYEAHYGKGHSTTESARRKAARCTA